MKKLCSQCAHDSDKNKCHQGHIRWKDGYTLKMKSVINCPDYQKRNGGKNDLAINR